MRCRRAQASVELMVILAVSMMALLVVYSLTTTQTLQIQAQQRVQSAQTAADSIALAANDVFFQGTGAKKRIFVILPDDVNAGASLISGKEVNYRVRNTDVFSVADVNLVGSLPTAPGGHYLTLVAHENYVSLGDSSLDVSKNSVYVALSQDSNASASVAFTNNSSSETATVNLVKTWASSAVAFTLSSASFTLGPGANRTIDFNFSSGSSAAGNYAGSVRVNADFNGASLDENITIPVNADVSAAQSQPAPDVNLTILPSTWNEAINRGILDTNSYQICNTSSLNMATVSFAKGSGGANAWLYDINSLSNLGPESCATKVLTLSPPGTLSEQTASGLVTATAGSSQDTINLTITIRIPSSYWMGTPSSGYDATSTGSTLSSTSLGYLSSSNGTRYLSDATWPKSASSYDDAKYIEFVFSPDIPAGSTIEDVNILHEYSLGNSATIVAKLRLWDADTNSWTDQGLTSASGTTDVTDTPNLYSTIDSVNAVNNFKARFQMYITTSTGRNSRQDFVRLGIKYKPP